MKPANAPSISLAEFQQRHTPIELPIVYTCGREPTQFRGYRLKQFVAGCTGLWSLEWMHREVCGAHAPFPFSKWYQNWWPWWGKALSRMGLPDGDHLRKPAQILARDDDEQHDVDGRRFLPEPVCSSYALP